MPPEKPEPCDEDHDLTAEEEDELERDYLDSIEADRRGELLPWEAVFPPQRLTG